ncbi:AI-2E family transporter [Jiella endophytica]|uniref:AI-2E family transporter n=1 Tax=Jiella endophytica TaxID=2558362 RepID=A0A4Y8R9I7_9HYPH|nr:AI-2E family transporter [Jiella endophytica]TFF18381.1 AI-2E family transporter [Jiella endophytica]
MKDAVEEQLTKKATIVTSVVLAMTATVALVWAAAMALLLIFGGMLLAAIVAALARPLQWAGLRRGWAFAIVIAFLFVAIGGGLFYGGFTLVNQFHELWRQLREQLQALAQTMGDMGLQPGGNGGDGKSVGLDDLLPNPSGIFSSASQAMFSVLGALGNVFVVVFIAIFLLAQPETYRRGLVSLFPKAKRARLDETIGDATEELILWVCGTGISMAIVFVVTFVGLWLIGMPSAFLLALQAGVLAFIPTLGPFIAGIPIVLVGLSESMQMALLGLGVYVLVQSVESNVAQPVAQRYTSALPPVLTLGAQVVFGVLLGTIGIALAVPLIAVIMVFVRELYVNDTLGGPHDSAPDAA